MDEECGVECSRSAKSSPLLMEESGELPSAAIWLVVALLVEAKSGISGDARGGSCKDSLLIEVVATTPVGVGGPSSVIISKL